MSESDINNLIAKKISHYLYINEKSQQDLADYMGVSQATVSNWCKGIKMPRMDKIDKICTYFNCNRSDLMEDTSEQPITLAAHFDGNEYTPEELEEIKKFAEFVKSKR